MTLINDTVNNTLVTCCHKTWFGLVCIIANHNICDNNELIRNPILTVWLIHGLYVIHLHSVLFACDKNNLACYTTLNILTICYNKCWYHNTHTLFNRLIWYTTKCVCISEAFKKWNGIFYKLFYLVTNTDECALANVQYICSTILLDVLLIFLSLADFHMSQLDKQHTNLYFVYNCGQKWVIVWRDASPKLSCHLISWEYSIQKN